MTAEDGALLVSDLPANRVGELAHAADVVLHELFNQQASLEEAFIALTSDSVEFHGHSPVSHATAVGPPADPLEPLVPARTQR